MSPEQAAIGAVWKNKRFWLIQTLAWAVWTSLALSWFWLPDSKAWGVALAIVQALAVIIAGLWLVKKGLSFYRPERKANFPRLLLDAAILIAIGVYVPYKLIGWHPTLSSFGAQTFSLAIRFGAAFLIAVTVWLIVAALLGRGSAESPSQSSSIQLAPQTGQPN